MPKLLSFKEFVEIAEGSLIEPSHATRYWFHVKTKKLVKVTEKWHDWAPIGRPEAFGLKPDQVQKFQMAMDRGADIIKGVATLMGSKGYIRLSAERGEWIIRSGTLSQAAAAAKAMSKKHPAPKRLYMDAGSISKMLVAGEITDFIKTGKIVQRTEIGSTMARSR